jgi:large subunit ribosomal protein L18
MFTVPFRRKQEGKTDYKVRLALLKSKKLRLVVRKSNKNVSAQLAKYDEKGDVIVYSAHSSELKKYGWDISKSSTPAVYLVGLLLGVKAKGEEAILDIGLQNPIKGAKMFAVLKGAADGGLVIPFSEEVLPKKERLEGKHLSDNAVHTKNKKHETVSVLFKKTKEAILATK